MESSPSPAPNKGASSSIWPGERSCRFSDSMILDFRSVVEMSMDSRRRMSGAKFSTERLDVTVKFPQLVQSGSAALEKKRASVRRRRGGNQLRERRGNDVGENAYAAIG